MRHHRYRELCQRIVDAGGQPYVVGGYVRDILLGRSPKDVDILVVGMDVDKLLGVLGNVDPVGNSFPVFLVDGAEVALARTEQKWGKGYRAFKCEIAGVTLEQDLFRRDLTINAMAMDPFTDEILDPYNGSKDLAAKVLRPVGPHFGEDPVRILRAARFAAQLDMAVTPELIEAAHPALAELIDEPGERIWGELEKALRTDKPSLFLEALDQLGALEITLPEIHALKGRIQPEKHHPEGDAYIHTLQVVDQARRLGGDDETMFAALTHDLGKAVTPDDNLPHHYNHEALGVPLVNAMCDRLRIPNGHRRVAAAAAREHLNVHRFDDLKPVTKVRLLMRLGVVQDNLLANRVVLAAKADARGRGPLHADNPYPQGDRLLAAAEIVRSVKGNEYANLRDGRVIAQKMEEKRVKVLKGLMK